MNITNNWYNMNKEALIPRIIFDTDMRCTRYSVFTATCNNKLALFHISKIYTCIVSPKLMEFKRALVAEDIIVEVIVNMIAISRSLPLDNDKILNVSTQRIILLQIKYRAFDFLTSITYLLTNGISLCQIIFGRFRVVLKQVIERKLTFLIVNLNFEDMFEVVLIELEIFGVNIIYSLVDRHNFLILIFELLQFALLNLEAAIRYRKKYKHDSKQRGHNIHIARPKSTFIIATIHR